MARAPEARVVGNADFSIDDVPMQPGRHTVANSEMSPGAERLQIDQVSELEQGVDTRVANARMVQEHEDELLMQHFRCWIIMFATIAGCAMPVVFGLLIWLAISYYRYWRVACEVPLQLWVIVVFCIVIFNSTCNYVSPRSNGSCIQRVLCCWQRDPSNPRQVPLRVWWYNLSVMVLTFAWNCAGLHWVANDGKSSTSARPPCKEAAPALFTACKVYAAFNMALTLFMYINMIGFSQFLRFLWHRGLMGTTNAAPQGSLERNTEVVALDHPLVQESVSCSICMEDFQDGKTIVKTKVCSHVYHMECLKGWLRGARTCPLCRQDLGSKSPEVGFETVSPDSRDREPRQAWE